jgi:high-affinity iron transporter
MFTAALIVFREVFEIAIIVCIILAATRQVARRGLWIGSGIAAGGLLVGLLACFAPVVNQLASQLGQHVFHALILSIAALLIGWSVVWMQGHGREIAVRMKSVSAAVSSGQTPLYMLAVVTGLAVLREGSEIVLFLYGIFVSGEATVSEIAMGIVVGSAAGILTGVLMYWGMVRVPIKQLFSVSSALLALLAAGMAAKAVGHLVKANILPGLLNPIWDSSAILSQHSFTGRFFSIVVGYQDHPAGIQVLCYAVTLCIITLFFSRNNKLLKK